MRGPGSTEWEAYAANRLLSRQCHTITAVQAKDCGATKGAIDAKVRSGAWDRLGVGVYRQAGVAESWEQSLWIAHLTAGPRSTVSHESAAQLHGLRCVRQGVVALTVPKGVHHQIRGACITQSTNLLAAHQMSVRGLPVTTPARTVVDLAGRSEITPAQMDAIVVAAHRDRKASLAAIAAVAAVVRGRGRPGVRKLDQVFAARSPGEPVPASVLEERLDAVIGLAGLAALATRQHPLPGPTIGFVDVAFPEARLIAEADGRRWHGQELDMEHDRDRDNQAAALGWLTMRFMHRHLDGDPDGAANQIRAAYDRRVRPR
jgi:very-short-patch-repair endonuclease